MKRQITCVLVSVLGALLFWLACGGSTTPPTVTSTTLAKVLTTGTLSVTFSEAMDEDSVEAAFSITGSDPVPGTFTWEDNTVTFTRESGFWKTHHEYTLTIDTGAKSLKGVSLEETFTETFKPELNLHDVNGDGIDDFLISAPHAAVGGNINAGAAYFFKGKSEWSDVDLASQKADATIQVDANDNLLGFEAKVVGDINGDGYADIVISAPAADGVAVDEGYIAIIFGSAEGPSDLLLTTANIDDLDGLLVGPEAETALGVKIIRAGDVNGDGLADFVVGGKIEASGDTIFWLMLGTAEAYPSPSAFTSIASVSTARYIVTGYIDIPATDSLPGSACDLNGDELDDLILGSPISNGGGTERGEVYVVAGSATPADIDLRTEAPSAKLSGESDNSAFGGSISCNDINGDMLNDLIIGAPKFDSFKGRVYVVLGTGEFKDYNFATDIPSATFTGETQNILGTLSCVPGDVNEDGINDILISAPFHIISGVSLRGSAHFFLGKTTPTSVDFGSGGVADATYVGEIPSPPSGTDLGFCKTVGDVNGDSVDDLLIGAPGADGGGNNKGQVYLILGIDGETPRSIDFEDENTSDATFTGAADNDLLWLLPVFFPS